MADTVTLKDQKRQWELLLESPAWLRLRKVLQEQTDNLQRTILLTPLARLDEALAQEFSKGKLAGMLALEQTIEGVLMDLEMEIEKSEREDGSRTE